MCTVAGGFSTIVGTRGTLDAVEEVWRGLPVVQAAWAQDRRFVLRRMGLADLHPSFENHRAPDIAAIWHEDHLQPGATNQLQGELLIRGIPVVCEKGYFLDMSGAANPPGQGTPIIAIDAQAAGSATVSQPPAHALGTRVAVLDTGDLGGHQPTMVDTTLGSMNPNANPDDAHGHGTAVAALITTINPAADIYPIRVVNANLTASYELLCGLAYALWTQQYDVVNVSLSMSPPGGCPTVLGTSLEYILAACHNAGVTPPRLVAAAGNLNANQKFGYPAQLPDAIVVLASDWHGHPAAYNVAVPTSVTATYASGGDMTQSFGTITRPGQPPEQLFGTSFAAAVVTANII